MLTLQGSILIALSVVAASAGIILQQPLLEATGLALVIWIWIEWIWFELSRRQIKRFISQLERTINQDDGATLTMVADRRYQVSFSGPTNLLPRGYCVLMRDIVPDPFQIQGSAVTLLQTDAIGWFRHRVPERIQQNYSIQTSVCGAYNFPGIAIEFTDQRGLFTAEYFAPVIQRANVLPYLIRPQTTVSVLKRNNLERHLGHHRHTSSGISSELHGIRDYRVGDPPRSIAWKATARLGKLMTCEFESEVPIRATLLIDFAAYQFDGRPGPTAGDRAISTAASIAKLLLADRDPVAAELIHDERFDRLDHGSGERQLVKLVQYLLKYSNPNAPLEHFYLRDLIQIVFENASRRFPELLDQRVNYGRTRFHLFQMVVSKVFFLRYVKFLSPVFDRHKRRSISVLFEYLFQLLPGSANQMQFDDAELRRYCLEYADRFNVVSSSTTVAIDPPYQDVGHWLRARNKMILKLCERITNARARAKDNELFVVIAPEPYDLLGCEMIEAAVKNVVASGHRLMFIAPERPVVRGVVEDPDASDIINRYVTGADRNAHSDLGERIGRVGATFARIDDPKLMQLVANEIGLLQSSASRSRSAGVSRAPVGSTQRRVP